MVFSVLQIEAGSIRDCCGGWGGERGRELYIPIDDLNMGGFPGGGAPVGLSVG